MDFYNTATLCIAGIKCWPEGDHLYIQLLIISYSYCLHIVVRAMYPETMLRELNWSKLDTVYLLTECRCSHCVYSIDSLNKTAVSDDRGFTTG